MKSLLRSLTVILLILAALPAFSDDQQKAKKEANKFIALASDGIGRTVVNLSMAETFNIKRPDLVMERRDTGMNYGALFIAQELIAAGAKREEIAAQLKAGKTIYQIGDERHANWSQIAADAKKLNSKIDNDLYQRLLDRKAGTARDQADGYMLSMDGVTADNDVSKGDISEAEDRYVKKRDQADEANRRANKLDTSAENSARRDNLRSSGPGGNKPPTGVDPNR
jgi:hypothetical protein